MSPSQYSRCSNPYKVKNHNKRRSLRKPSDIQMKKWGLTISNYLCVDCRKQLNSSKVPPNECASDLSQNVDVADCEAGHFSDRLHIDDAEERNEQGKIFYGNLKLATIKKYNLPNFRGADDF